MKQQGISSENSWKRKSKGNNSKAGKEKCIKPMDFRSMFGNAPLFICSDFTLIIFLNFFPTIIFDFQNDWWLGKPVHIQNFFLFKIE